MRRRVFGFLQPMGSYCGTLHLTKSSKRQKLASQLRGMCLHLCVCVQFSKVFSASGSQGLVYRRLETANMLHSGTVRLHCLHVLVQDGKYLIVEDLVLPDAICHLLQRLRKKRRDVFFGLIIASLQQQGKIEDTQQITCTHHIFDDLVLAILPLDFEQVVAEVEEVKATLLSQQHDDGTAGPVQPIPKALPVRTSTNNTGRGRRGALSLCDAQLEM